MHQTGDADDGCQKISSIAGWLLLVLGILQQLGVVFVKIMLLTTWIRMVRPSKTVWFLVGNGGMDYGDDFGTTIGIHPPFPY